MKIWHVLFFLSLLVFTSCNKTSQNQTTTLNGAWEFTASEDLNWKLGTVPGTVQTDLLRLGEIPDPFKGNNEDSIQWVSDKDWQYKRAFTLSEETLQKKKHLLRFHGLDTYATVFLNDSLLLTANNAFRTWEVDVSELLKLENEIRIAFSATDSTEKIEANKLNYELPEAPRVFTRKPQFQYGWDWGPKIKTMGVWRDVLLRSYNNTDIEEVYIETGAITTTDSVNLTVHVSLDVLEEQKLAIEISNQNTNETYTENISVVPGKSTYNIPLTLQDPKFWYPHNLGDPYLYSYVVRLKKGKTIIDSISKKVGLRTVELVTEKDSIGEGFYFKVNGKSVYMKGANYIPQNIFLPEVTLEDREQLLNDVVDANMNMLRVWGGGVYEDDAFYELCDEKGILVWQDFMFACAMYPGDDAFLDNVKQEAIENVKRLRQHPSIALWCGNNENNEGWHRWGWQAGKTEVQKEEIWKNYQKLFNDILPNVIDSLHPSIDYWESSPKYGRGDKRYQFEGDAHDWWVWHDAYPFEHFEEEVPRFMSEFGFQSFPSYEAIQYFTEQGSIDIAHPSFATHQKHSRGFSLIKEYMERDYPVPVTGEDYVYVSQLLQAYGITKGIYAHRRAKPYNMGTLYWQLNDCWPVVSWSSIDGLGNWKALHYKAKMAFKNRLIIAWEEGENLNITIADDHLEHIEDTLRIFIKDFKGTILKSQTVHNVTTNTRRNEVLYSMSLADFEFNPRYSFAEITFDAEKTVYYFTKPKELKLQQKEIDQTFLKTEKGFQLSLSSETLQKDVFLIASEPGTWSDNFFDLLPGEVKVVQFSTTVQKVPNLKIKTLNQLIE